MVGRFRFEFKILLCKLSINRKKAMRRVRERRSVRLRYAMKEGMQGKIQRLSICEALVFALLIINQTKTYLRINILFMPSSQIICLILISVLAASIQATTTYSYAFSTSTSRTTQSYYPTYSLGSLTATYFLQITVNIPGYAVSADTLPPNAFTTFEVTNTATNAAITCTPPSTAPPNVYTSIIRCVIPSNGTYILTLISSNRPSNTAGSSNPKVLEHFNLLVTYFNNTGTLDIVNKVNERTLLKLTDTFRDRVAKLVYVASSSAVIFTLYPVQAASLATGFPDTPVATENLRLYRVTNVRGSNNIYSAGSGADLLSAGGVTWAYSNATKLLRYTVTLSSGFYILTANYDTTGVSPVIITFQSNQYTCPYTAGFPDYYSNFQPCTGSVPAPYGEPCLSYDFILGVCTSCSQGFTLVNGTCLTSTACPDRFYFKFGQCLPVSPNCGEYDSFTGQCKNCRDGVNFLFVNGECAQRTVTCGPRQYAVNYICYNVSQTCQGFNSSGACTSCILNHTLVGTACVPTVIICGAQQYLDSNNNCVTIPSECQNFNSTLRKCQFCYSGYLNNNGVCERLRCPDRQVPSRVGLDCINVSPLCGAYDPLTGLCLNCINSGYTVRNGICLQITSPLAGCHQRQILGFGPCIGNEVFCELFDLTTLNCAQCMTGYHLDYAGICRIAPHCPKNQWNNNGVCVPIPLNCLNIDNSGNCIECQRSYRIVNGQCAYEVICPAGQYLHSSGACVNNDPRCETQNPTTGQCTSCKTGFDLSGGVCCPNGQILSGAICVTVGGNLLRINSGEQECIQWHPTLSKCVQCNRGFKVNPVAESTCIPA